MNTEHLDYDPLLISITNNHKEVKEKTLKLQRELDNVQKLIKSLVEEEQTLLGSINASRAEESSLLERYETARENVLNKWSQLSVINQIDCFWNVLPTEVLAIIFSYLDYREVLHSVAMVNRKWNEIVFSNNQLWYSWLSTNRWVWGSSKCILNSADTPTHTITKQWLSAISATTSQQQQQQQQQQNNNDISIANININNDISQFIGGYIPNKYPRKDYKDSFIEAAKSERRWKKGEAVYGSFKSGHPSLSCISLDHRYMITARRSFKIWDIHFSEAPRCVKILDPHLAHNTKCMQVNGDLLIAGGKYGLKVLNIENSQSHLICEDECYALHFDNHTLVHGSFNQIVVRDMHTLKPVHTFIGHGNMVKGICRNDDTIVTASWLQTKIWDLRTKVCQKIMHSGVKRNCCVADDSLVVSSNGRVVHVWDLRVHKESLLLNRSVSALYLEGQKMVIARKDRCIDIMNAKLDPTPYVVLGPIMTEESVENSTRITSIKTHYRKMIAGTSKGTVHVWEF